MRTKIVSIQLICFNSAMLAIKNCRSVIFCRPVMTIGQQPGRHLPFADLNSETCLHRDFWSFNIPGCADRVHSSEILVIYEYCLVFFFIFGKYYLSFIYK